MTTKLFGMGMFVRGDAESNHASSFLGGIAHHASSHGGSQGGGLWAHLNATHSHGGSKMVHSARDQAQNQFTGGNAIANLQKRALANFKR
eukprot:CAMPEP_0173389906 /NCGR_PEP_ID=MMETSP1356-20130122/13943_1 /TAXON_ID=77927 ORGANISM="Hemiselmis virescens, Strain PCC157" /NCGR_SAMPLE_ID=MMETSP1356 /ASSEMBLY_ACC=CAM_ASM_000847 /LENGTH=89 /DNA_ID=CAMNT_0014347187 /DNA_START=16 /DNA_END=285 /DNA_ORIENTATION=-